MPMHRSFYEIRRSMIKDYGKKKGTQVFWSWINKHNLDETRPMDKQKIKKKEEDAIQDVRHYLTPAFQDAYDKWHQNVFGRGIFSVRTKSTGYQKKRKPLDVSAKMKIKAELQAIRKEIIMCNIYIMRASIVEFRAEANNFLLALHL